MHLHTVLAFGFLIWRMEQPPSWRITGEGDVVVTLLFALGLPVVSGLVSSMFAHGARRRVLQHPESLQRVQHFHHRVVFILRIAVSAIFGVTVLLTEWSSWFELRNVHPALQVFGDAAILLPFFASAIALWIGSYPLDREFRRLASLPIGDAQVDGTGSEGSWHLGSYLNFNLRHHILILAVPMLIILMAFNVVEGYDEQLRELTGWFWAGDVVLGGSALCVFIAAPLMLTKIWSTTPLEDGPLRDRLEASCNRIGLKCRDILVWHSDGIMINAAVMGVVAPLRYVMLSDGLLESMTDEQVESVFGHEAGHVHHRHIQFFLLFAYAGWLVVAGAMDLLLQVASMDGSWLTLSVPQIQGFGVCVTILLWGFGFGWVSRKFERQADVFGALSVTPKADRCIYPCSVHMGDGKETGLGSRVCATGAAVFANALDRVAILNGIPHEERSWRHSSIGSRIRFLKAQAGDPALAEGFARQVRRIKTVLVVVAVVGSVVALVYYTAAESLIMGQAGGG